MATASHAGRPAGMARFLARLRGRFDGYGPELRQTIRTLVSVLLSDIVANAAGLHEPYWALITAVIVTQARITSTLEAGRDQIYGTLIGAVAGAAAIGLSLAGWPRDPVFCLMLVPLAVLAAFRPNLRLAGVTLVVVFLFPAQGGPFSRPIDRVLAILVGAGVSLLVSYFVFHSRARALAFQAAAEMLKTIDATRARILGSDGPIPSSEVEQLNDRSSEALKNLVAAIAEARRERLSALEQHEPLMIRLVPMLRRLQSDMLFVARAIEETNQTDMAAPPNHLPAQISVVSDALSETLTALREAFEKEAATKQHRGQASVRRAHTFSETLDMLGDDAGPLVRFTLQMLSRDLEDVATALETKPEKADHT